MGVSASAHGNWMNPKVQERWDKTTKENTKDRGIRYIVTGNLLQAFGFEDLKGKLISFTTDSGTTRKGILLPDTWSEMEDDGSSKNVYTIVPIGKAVKVIKSMSVDSMIISDSGLTIGRNQNGFKIIVSRSRSVAGDIYLDKDLLALLPTGNFNSVSATMVAEVPEENITRFCQVLQKNHSLSVRLLQW